MTAWDVVEPVLTLFLSVSSLVVASIALTESARNGQAQREHARLSVKPLLHTWLEDSAPNRSVVLLLKNNGVGPAIINQIRFFPDGKPHGVTYKLENIGFLLDAQVDRFFDRASFRAISLASAYALPAGSQLTLLTIETKPDLPGYEAERLAIEVRQSLSCSIEYENIYGEVVQVVDP